MKILLATDGSLHAEFAERFTTALLCHKGKTFDLEGIAVCPSPDLHFLGAEITAPVHGTIDEFRQRMQGLLDAVESRVGSRVRSCKLSLLDGHPAHEILQRIEESQPDLCVVGSHGWTFSERVFLGSVSSQVAKHAACSILIVKPHENIQEEATCRTILVAEDGSGVATKVLAKLKHRCDSKNVNVQLVSVVHEDYSVEPLVPEQFAEIQLRKLEERRAQLAELADGLRPDWKEVDDQVRSGNSVTGEIIESASVCKADLIVVSSEPKSLLKRVFLGSNALGILHRAPCSVWIDRMGAREVDTL